MTAGRIATAAAALLAMPALAAAQEGYSLQQLLQYGFTVQAASPLTGRCADGPVASCASEVLFLQGKLPSSSSPILVRCAVRTTAEGRADNCQRVY
ncbi:hypothetical protein [Sphingomonas sp. ID0503]|uniref:hypothetical protein n=1 Tax=Sphingomonas sp. ID0503 TaxID=3399691 RepID=UPI003AFAAAFE